MKELFRKFYGLEIEIKRFPLLSFRKKLSFKYREGTMEELQEVIETVGGENEEKKLRIWLFDFLNRHGEISARQFSSLSQNMVEQALIFILRTWGGGYFKDLTEKRGEEDEKPTAPESSSIVFLLQHSNETVASLSKMTWRQLDFLVKGIVYNENAKTKEGQIENLRNEEGNTDADALARIKAWEEKNKAIFKK